MKRRNLLLWVAATVLAVGCYDDSALVSRVDALEDDMTMVNDDLSALKTRLENLEENVYVTGVTEITGEGSAEVIGYTISLSEGNPITIRHGEDGEQGENGLTPVVTVEGNEVVITLGDETPVRIPYRPEFRLNISSESVAVLPGETIEVPYTLTGADASTLVYVVADGGYVAKVVAESISVGNIEVSVPAEFTDGRVVVFAGNSTSAAMAVLSFEEGTVTISENEFTVAKEGGSVEIPVAANLVYDVVIPEDASWLSYVETRAMRNETVVLNVAANESYARKTNVDLKVGDKTFCTFTVSQAGAVEASFTAEDLVGTWTVTYNNMAGTLLEYVLNISASSDLAQGNLVLDHWFDSNANNAGKTIYATFDGMELSIADNQAVAGNWNDGGRAKYDGNYLSPIVFTLSNDGQTLSIHPDTQFGSYYLSSFTPSGSNYTLTKNQD